MQLEEGDVIKIGKTKVTFKYIVPKNFDQNSSYISKNQVVTDR